MTADAEQAVRGEYSPRSIAIVSGKGGSGKTVVASVVARLLDRFAGPLILMDADIGTGGLTYYLGLKQVATIAGGLSDIATPERDFGTLDERLLQPVRGFDRTRLLGIGDHRVLHEHLLTEEFARILQRVLVQLKSLGTWLVVDCRGGIDAESLEVCRVVDDILVVVEPDTTSFQATEHLISMLSRHRLAGKLRGFVINKVFVDPTQVALSGTSTFKTQYLGSIPFERPTAAKSSPCCVPCARIG